MTIGLFAVAEMFRLLAAGEGTISMEGVKVTGSRMNGVKSVIKHKYLLLRCSVIGLLVGVNIWNLIRQFRERAAGARLTGKLVTMFIVLTLVPVTIVFSFSLKFINSGIDSWFDVEVERALDQFDALLAKLTQGRRIQFEAVRFQDAGVLL
jgi:nitrogen fixation/metabolism regulation signal transduction histidine kinase